MAEGKLATGRISEFHQGVDTVKDYAEIFSLYCEAKRITDVAKKKGIFLTVVGASTYTLLKLSATRETTRPLSG